MIGGASMCLSVILLVNKFQCWLVRKVENNLRCKTFLYSTIEMTVSWKPWSFFFWVWKRNDRVLKTISALFFLSIYICLYICKHIGSYFTFTCTYVGHMCMLIFPVDGRIILRLRHCKAWCWGYFFFVWPLLFVRWQYRLSNFEKVQTGLWTGSRIYTLTYSWS